MVASIARLLKGPVAKIHYEFLNVEDIANAVISTLATPPDVLVSIFKK